MTTKYSANVNRERIAKGSSFSLPISIKHTIEVSHFIKKKELSKAMKMLEEVMEKKRPVPFTKFNKGGVGHKKGGVGPGRYPVKACFHILKLLKSVEANAKNAGLNVSGLVIHSIIPQKAPKAWHYGRHSRRRMKRSNIQLIVEEREADKKGAQKPSKKQEKTAGEAKK